MVQTSSLIVALGAQLPMVAAAVLPREAHESKGEPLLFQYPYPYRISNRIGIS